MTATRLWVHPLGDRKSSLNLSRLPGDRDLLYLFHGFAAEIVPDQLRKSTTESLAVVKDLLPKGRTLTLEVEVGRYGEEGTITNVHTMQESARFTKDDAPLVITHGVLVVPENSPDALLFLERSMNQSGTSRVLELFIEQFHLVFPEYRLEHESIVESEAWLKSASLVRVSAHAFKKDSDRANNNAVTRKVAPIGELAHTLVPTRREKFLPRWIYEQLTSGKLKAGELLAFPEGDEPSEVEVTLQGNGQTKTFVIGRERRPAISYLLSQHGEGAPGIDAVRNRALNECKDLFKRLSVDWSESSALAPWTPDQLAARLAVGSE